MEEVVKVLISIALVGVVGLFFRLCNALVVKPERLRSIMRKQGISGPPPSLLVGNILQIKKSLSTVVKVSSPETHNSGADIFPFFEQWRKIYGQVHVFSLANTPILFVNQPQLAREMATSTSPDWGKPVFLQEVLGPLLGKGIVTSNGHVWARNRKVLAPEMNMDKTKGRIGLILESVDVLLKSWKSMIEAADQGGIAEIKIDDQLRSLTTNIISRACFGSSYKKGEEIFSRFRVLADAMSKRVFTSIPGMTFVPTKHNRHVWAMEKDIRNMILEVVREREKSGAHGDDLLQKIMEGAKNSELSQEATEEFMVDTCKNIYFAGYDTTSTPTIWCLMLLAAHPDWQARVRDEVVEICKGTTPDADMLRRMKLLTMVIRELLRLYPPSSAVAREALADMKFGGIHVPKGLNVWMMLVHLHTDPENWGPDAYKFNPERFANGISGACKFPNAYMPFGRGPRVCLGQHLAMMELKIFLCQILSNFSFTLSPNFKYSATFRLVTEPENGVTLLVKKL